MIASEANFGVNELLSKTGFTFIWKNVPMLILLDYLRNGKCYLK